MLVPRIEAGTVVEPGTVLAEVWHPSGERLQALEAPSACFVLAWADRGILEKGEPACTLGVPEP